MGFDTYGLDQLHREQARERDRDRAVAVLRHEFEDLVLGQEGLHEAGCLAAVGKGEERRLARLRRLALVFVVGRRRPDQARARAAIDFAQRADDLGGAVGPAHKASASKSSTTRPMTRPACRSSSAAFASLPGRVLTGSGLSLPFLASATSSFSSCRLPRQEPTMAIARCAIGGRGCSRSTPRSTT